MNKNLLDINLELNKGYAIDLNILGYKLTIVKHNSETLGVFYQNVKIGELNHNEAIFYSFKYFGDDFGSYDVTYDKVTSIKQILGVLLYHDFDIIDYDNY